MTAKRKSKFSFEEGMQALEGLTERMSEGKLTLEESLKTYEQGMELAAQLEEMLAQHHKRLEQIDPNTGEITALKEE